jgi:hypothetical protein
MSFWRPYLLLTVSISTIHVLLLLRSYNMYSLFLHNTVHKSLTGSTGTYVACGGTVSGRSSLARTTGARVLWGTEVTTIANAPWMASIRMGGAHKCNAVVIHPRHFLTARTCVDSTPTTGAQLVRSEFS